GMTYGQSLPDVWNDSVVHVAAYWQAQKMFQALMPSTSGGSTTWTWTSPVGRFRRDRPRSSGTTTDTTRCRSTRGRSRSRPERASARRAGRTGRRAAVSSARFSPAASAAAVAPASRGWHADCFSCPIVDFELTGSLILFAAAIPYVVEVLRQTPLQARVIAALPPATRAALPPHPRHPWLTVFGSVRFFLALFRWALRDAPDD